MKRVFSAFFVLFVCGAYAETYLDTENRFWFTDDVVKNAIIDFVPAAKQQSVANLYQELMDQVTGKISIDSLFKVCRKSGFNTYKYDGFMQCKAFIQKMLTDAEMTGSVNLNGFCPGVDAQGNNPNRLRSITDKTRIGDFCSSTNIRMGQVIFKPGYNCSCMASVCNTGFEFQGGACVTKIPAHSMACQRQAHSVTSVNNSLEKCQAFCEQKYQAQSCQFMAVVYDDSQCICSPTDAEIENAYNALQETINNLQYYDVCRNGNSKTGNDVCDKETFNWVNVGKLQAAGLIEEYARVRYNDSVHCNITDTRGYWNDDYIKCSSLKQKKYYEFKFDDIKESVDSDIQPGVVLGICNIHNMDSNVMYSGSSLMTGSVGMYLIQNIYNRTGNMGCKSACTPELIATAQHMGLSAITDGDFCVLSGRSIKSSELESKLAKIDGIDNYVFYHGVQIQGSQNIISQLRQYIKSTGYSVRSFDCSRNVGEIKNGLIVGDDDVLHCNLNGKPIDFVFDDFSESWLYVQEMGENAIQCIVSGGKYSGQECYGLTQQQCIDANTVFKKKFPGASGMHWNGKECTLLDAAEAQKYDIAVQAGIGLVAAADCVLLTHTGCLILAVETAGLVAELTSGVAIENRAGEFLSVSTRCYERSCAADTIRNAGRVLSVMDKLDAASINSVDQELARLVGYLEPADLSGVSNTDWETIVTQLGGDPNDTSGTALVWLNRIGLGAQFISIGASGFRVTAKAITKLATKGSKASRAASTVARVAESINTANNFSDIGRVANVAGDATRAAGKADEAIDVMAFVNANRLRNGTLNADELSKLRKYYPGLSDVDLQKQGQAIAKELDAQRLMNGGITNAEFKVAEDIERAANGGVTNLEKARLRYKNALKLGTEQVNVSDGWVYIIKSGYTDDMVDAAGLKYHLNVNPDDVEKAAQIIQGIVSKYDIPQWKFSETATWLVGTAQEGKQFTLYMGKHIGQNETLLKQLAKEIDQTLSANGIRTGRVGENLATGDRLVPGSKFVHYRYDQVDAAGNIGGYNSSYKFVAPKTGDVLRKSDNFTDVSQRTFGNVKKVGAFDARNLRLSDGTGKLYVRNSASEMLGFRVNGASASDDVEQLYGIIRRGVEYPVNDTKVSRAISAMERPSNNAISYIAPRDNFNWHVHRYNGPHSTNVSHHISLNVDVDDTLIRKLDEIIAKDQGRHIVDFKIPPKGNRWKIMADPISIYMSGTSPEIERAIAEAAKPYVRTSDAGLLGRKIENGVAIAFETSGSRSDIVQDIINQVAKKDRNVAQSLRYRTDEYGRLFEKRYSVGQTEALRIWASEFLGYVIPPVVP